MIESWKDIKGYNGIYQISSFGNVRNISKSSFKMLKIYDNNNGNGYKFISLQKNKVPKSFYIHRLVLIAFIGNPPDDYEANHKDGIKSNNSLNNLEWVSKSENMLHKTKVLGKDISENHYRYGKYTCYGESNVLSKKYIVTDPQGKESLIHGLRAFCKTQSLNYSVMAAIANNHKYTHTNRGWKCKHA